MQANDVNQALKRVSSDEIKRNYTQITGREALERLLAVETVYSIDEIQWRIIDDELMYLPKTRSYDTCELRVNDFLNPRDKNWYVAPPFDARKEMLARPGEWVAKYFSEYEQTWYYLGFDRNEMIAIGNEDIKSEVSYALFCESPEAEEIDRAIPLDDADLAKLASLSKEGE